MSADSHREGRCVALNTTLLSILLVAATALCVAGVWAFVEIARASRAAGRLSTDLDAGLVPLMEKADVTVDAINIELLRIDGIVGRVEEITDRVESTSRTVQGVANAPAEIVTDIADRVRRAWKQRQAEAAARTSRKPKPPEARPEGEWSEEEYEDSDQPAEEPIFSENPVDATASVD